MNNLKAVKRGKLEGDLNIYIYEGEKTQKGTNLENTMLQKNIGD